MNRIIHLEDHGQDVSRFIVGEDYEVLVSVPSESWEWKNWIIHKPKVGKQAVLKHRRTGELKNLDYPITEIEELQSTKRKQSC